MANGHGGRRPGAGRKKGSKDKQTEEREKAIAKSGLTPLDYMLSVLRNKAADKALRMEAAKAAAPYCHPRLAQVDHGGSIELTHEEMLDELDG